MDARRVALAVALVAIGAYLTSIGNGFAYDDTGLILANPVVQDGALDRVLTTPYWPQASRGSGLFRPLTTGSFLLEWQLWGEWALPYHIANVVLHALNATLVAILGGMLVTVPAGAVAGFFFAVHPVHAEAVANIAGRSELLACGFLLTALLLFLRADRSGRDRARIMALVALPTLFLLGLASKEIAITFPVLLILAARMPIRGREVESLTGTVRRLTPLLAVLAAVVVAYGAYRVGAIGAFAGDAAAPELRSLSTTQRIMTGVSLWPEYLRLTFFPLDLSADYGPAVLLPAVGFDAPVAAGMVVIGLLALAGFASRSREPAVALGILWFAAAVLPVSQLLFPTGTMLAERTLYLPSVGAALAIGAAFEWLRRSRPDPVWVPALAIVLVLFVVRTGVRNPTWRSTFDMYRTLHRDHPESFLAQRARAAGLAQVGDMSAAGDAYRLSVELAPRHYATLAEAGEFFGRQRNYALAERLLRRAIDETPTQALAYRLLSAQLIRQGRVLEGHGVAAEGLARAGEDPELYRNLSEAYVAMDDLQAAARARVQVVRLDPESSADRERLEELLQHRPPADAGISPE